MDSGAAIRLTSIIEAERARRPALETSGGWASPVNANRSVVKSTKANLDMRGTVDPCGEISEDREQKRVDRSKPCEFSVGQL